MRGDWPKAIGLPWPSPELEPGIYWFRPKAKSTPRALTLRPFWRCGSALGSFGPLKQLVQLPKGHVVAVYCPGALTWNRPVCRRDLWAMPCLGRRPGQEALWKKKEWRGGERPQACLKSLSFSPGFSVRGEGLLSSWGV